MGQLLALVVSPVPLLAGTCEAIALPASGASPEPGVLHAGGPLPQ
jgi:hypothetical protein